MAFEIEFAEVTRSHMKELAASERSRVLEAIEKQLLHEPFLETRNRKRLRLNPLAGWELRSGKLRIFYDVIEDRRQVKIVAIGRKIRNTLWIGREEIRL